MAYIIARLHEPSTWRGIVALLTGLGVWGFSPEQTNAIVAAGLTIIGLIGAFVPDAKPADPGAESGV